MGLLESLVGFGAGAALAGWIFGRPRRPALPPGFVELLPWGVGLVFEGRVLIVNKDGTLSSCFLIEGPDFGTSTSETLERLSSVVNSVLIGLAGEHVVHLDAIRRRASGYPGEGAFPDPLTAYLDELRREDYESESGEHFITETILTVTQIPPREIYARVALRFERGFESQREDWARSVLGFAERLKALEERLSSVVRVEALSPGRTLGHLRECATGLGGGRAADFEPGILLDTVLGPQDFVGGWEPRIGEMHLALVSVEGLPASTRPGELSVLGELPFPLRYSTRFIPLPPAEAAASIRRMQRQWFWAEPSVGSLLAGKEPAKGFENRHAAAMVEEAAEASALNESGEAVFGFLTSVVVLAARSREEVASAARQVLKVLADRGFSGRLETVGAVGAFLGSLPGVSSANVRRPLVNSLSAADLLPLTTEWPGEAACPCPFFPEDSPPLLFAKTNGATPFRLNLHTRDVGHTVIVGPTGSGKSTLLLSLLLNFLRYPESRVVLFDRDQSSRILCEAMPDVGYSLVGVEEGGLHFQPLRDLDDPQEMGWALAWIEFLIGLQNVTFNPAKRAALARGLELLREEEADQRSLFNFMIQVQDVELRMALKAYTRDGPYGYLLDATGAQGRGRARVEVYETRPLMDLDDSVKLPVLLRLLREVERGLDGSPTLILLDEAGIALMHPAWASRVQQWALSLRKKNASLVLAVQNLRQLDAHGAGANIRESCPTRFYLPNPAAMASGARELYESFGLNPREIELVARAEPRRDYYFSSPRGSRLFQLGLRRAELAFLSARPGLSFQSTVSEALRVKRTHGAHWVSEWLRECGCVEDAPRFSRFTADFRRRTAECAVSC
ncbi:MAG TPA: transporter [Thermoanaerobaculia bacterium]|nr:transporter [Thermoanaerobaculia bacterium]